MKNEPIRAVLVTVFGLRGLDRQQQRLVEQIDLAEERARHPGYPSREAVIDDLAESR